MDGFYLSTQVQRPESAGMVRIRSSDPATPPIIRYRFLETDTNRRVAIAGVRVARGFVAKPEEFGLAYRTMPEQSLTSSVPGGPPLVPGQARSLPPRSAKAAFIAIRTVATSFR